MADKYYRLVTFVVNICPRPLRELFVTKAKADINHQYTNLEDYLTFRRPDIYKLGSRCSFDQQAHIYPTTGSVDIQTWDVTLLSLLLKQLFRKELTQDERDCLYQITDIRNSLQHIAKTEHVDDHTFNTSWNRLKSAVITLAKSAGAPPVQDIEIAINYALTENMPSLGDVLRTWYKHLYVELQSRFSDLEKKLDFQAEELQAVKGEAKKANKFLTKASVKRKSRSGIPEKRLKIVDRKVERMRENLARALAEENDCKESFKNDISDITQQLTDNHRVIITGHDNRKTYKCALAAIQERNYQRPDQCLEINNPSDWKRICSEDAQFVLFREPFGIAAYDSQKVEVMLEEFDNMVDASNNDNDDVIDIVIVTNQRLLNEVTRRHEHEMLDPASTVYIDSTVDSNSGNSEETSAPEDTVYRNLLEHSNMYRQSYKKKTVDMRVKVEAEQLFIDHSAVAIVGPVGSGKTSVSFQLLPSYDLSNGEENFLVIMDPGELKYVKFSLRPVIIIKPLAGIQFDKVEAYKWYRQFDRLHAAVRAKKGGRYCYDRNGGLPNVASKYADSSFVRACCVHARHQCKGEGETYRYSFESIECGVQTETESHDDDQWQSTSQNNASTINDCQLRSVKAIRDYDTGQKEQTLITSGCVLPTGEILLTDFRYKKLIKLDRYYHVVSTCDLAGSSYDVCYTDNNTAVVALFDHRLQFIDITGNMTLIKVVRIDDCCWSVACHGNQLYVSHRDSIHIYTTDGEYKKVLYSVDNDDDPYKQQYFRSIAVSNDGGMIYIIDVHGRTNQLITIDSSGNHLYTLPDTCMIPGAIYGRRLCVDDQGYVYVIGYNDDGHSVIVQVSSDGKQNLGTVFEFEDEFHSIQFDRERSALLVAGRSDKLKVLTMR